VLRGCRRGGNLRSQLSDLQSKWEIGRKSAANAGITLRRDRQMPIAAIGQRRMPPQASRNTTAPRLDRRLDKSAKDLAERSAQT